MTKRFKLGEKEIGPGKPVYIIAEAGVNHNGDPESAIELVIQANETGADCVKFQTFQAEEIVTKSAPKAAYQLKLTDPKETQFQMLKNLELQVEDYKKIIETCKENGIHFLSTPYNFKDVDFLNELGVDGFKIASGQLVELPFLKYAANFGKPMVVSTGMATLGEVEEAVKTIRATGNDQIVLLQCTTNYPSIVEDANIRAMVTMGNALDVLVGYSDHTQNNYSVFAAVALGACIIEKHFTLDRNLPGPDHSCSLNRDEFTEMVNGVRDVERALGSAVKAPTIAESKNTVGMRRSIVANRLIPAGTVISQEAVGFKRPATGIEPRFLNKIVGKSARRDIYADMPIFFSDIDWE
jgi:N,N'-diacetyllegionaminate synthase